MAISKEPLLHSGEALWRDIRICFEMSKRNLLYLCKSENRLRQPVKKKRMKKLMIIILSIVLLVAAAIIGLLCHPAFGALPEGERLKRVEASKNYRNGKFHNRERTVRLTSGEGFLTTIYKNFFKKTVEGKEDNRRPKEAIKAVKTDLKALDCSRDQFVWFGHSSYLLILDGKTFLVDPVLTSEFPVSLMMKPFEGSDLYTPDDLPEVDYLLITHDHWDHLDYGTLKRIKGRVHHVICPLGVGAHLERWGYVDKTVEMDWDETYEPEESVKFICLTARHFSGRTLKRDQSLWASFVIEAGRTVFVSGDGGYGSHLKEIGERFPHIDLAMLENGQYNIKWANIHLLPSQMPDAIRALNACMTVPTHNSKFALSRHSWDEPMRIMQELAASDSTLHIQMPVIGQPIPIDKK